ncbi:MAG: hypothetical protein GY943_28005 [Chloroflexi bacterium]|nr:hypothetical protein [Chloroflexota bacterium]
MSKYIFITKEGKETPRLAQENGYHAQKAASALASILDCVAVDVSQCKTNADYDAVIASAV